MKTSILIVTHDTPSGLLEETLTSIRQQTCPDWELVIVDNGSAALHLVETSRLAERYGRFISCANDGYAAGMNLAAKHATGTHLLIAQPDGWFEATALDTLHASGQDPVGLVVYDWDWRQLRVQRYGASALDVTGFQYMTGKENTVLHCNPFLWIAKDKFEAIGGMDENLFLYGEEQNTALRLLARGITVSQSSASVRHFNNTRTSGLNPRVRYLANRNHVYNIRTFFTGIRKAQALTAFWWVCALETAFWAVKDRSMAWYCGLGAYTEGLRMNVTPIAINAKLPWRWNCSGVMAPVARRIFG